MMEMSNLIRREKFLFAFLLDEEIDHRRKDTSLVLLVKEKSM